MPKPAGGTAEYGYRNSLSAPLAALGQAAIVAAGPWLFTITAIALVTWMTVEVVGLETLARFRVVVIYAFCLSLVATGAVSIIATRLAADAIHQGRFGEVRPLFLVALIVGGGGTALVAVLVLALAFTLPVTTVLAGLSLSTLIALVWMSLTFCSAARSYAAVTWGFLTGLSIGVAGAVIAARAGYDALGMILAMCFGMLVVFLSLASSILRDFSATSISLSEAAADMAYAARRLKLLAVGGLVGACGLWIDKWLMWIGPAGEPIAGGLVHAPLYDSALFVAYLAIIPSLAMFVSALEAEFQDRFHGYYRAISNHATLTQIDAIAADLREETKTTLMRIMLIQAVVCTVVVMFAPTLVGIGGLHYQQTGILRIGTLGALFHFLFLTCTTLLLYLERYAPYLLLQIIFTGLLAAATQGTIWLGQTWYGLGYLAATAVTGLAAFGVLDRTLANVNYITFIMTSSQPPLMRPSTAHRRQRLESR